MPICKRCGVDHALAAAEGAHFEVEIRGSASLIEVNVKALLPIGPLQAKYGEDVKAFAEAISVEVPKRIRQISGLPDDGVEVVTHSRGRLENGVPTDVETRKYERHFNDGEVVTVGPDTPSHVTELLRLMGLPAGTNVKVVRSSEELAELLDGLHPAPKLLN